MMSYHQSYSSATDIIAITYAGEKKNNSNNQ